MHIVLSYCSPRSLEGGDICTTAPGKEISSSNYTIKGCTFSENSAGPNDNAEKLYQEDYRFLAEGFGRGGGLCVIIDKLSKNNSIQVSECRFTENSAVWGGGLYIAVVGSAFKNVIIISNCIFQKNNCTDNNFGGGGAIVGYQAYQGNYPKDNVVNFTSCSFEANTAGFGGGFSFYSSMSRDIMPNQMIFVSSNWTKNAAHIGAALNIAPQVWEPYTHDVETVILFSDCKFTSNRLLYNIETMETYTGYQRGGGTFIALGYHIQVQGTLTTQLVLCS